MLEEYANFCDEFVNVVGPSASMWDGQLRRINIPEHHVDLVLPNIRLIYSVIYPARRKDRDFKITDIDNMLAMKFIKSSHTEWASPVFFAPKKDRTSRFCVD